MDIFKNNGSKKLNLTILIIFLLMGFIGFLGVGDFFDNLYSQYPIIDQKTECRDRIIKITNEHGALLIKMATGIKICVVSSTFTNTKPMEIYNLFEKNDSILKMANSDALILSRNGLNKVLIIKSNTKTD